jgi:HEAT repeat protein
MSDEVQKANVQKWTEQLQSGTSTDRLEGATELASLAVRMRTRGAVRTRGTISRAAPSRLVEDVNLPSMNEAFSDEHHEVRRAVAFALGELSSENAVNLLGSIAETDSESVVRAEAIDALGKIGGQNAVDIINTALRRDPSAEVRIRAIRGLRDLARAEPTAGRMLIETLRHVAREDESEAVNVQIASIMREFGQGEAG